jgi:hypothetical protein
MHIKVVVYFHQVRLNWLPTFWKSYTVWEDAYEGVKPGFSNCLIIALFQKVSIDVNGVRSNLGVLFKWYDNSDFNLLVLYDPIIFLINSQFFKLFDNFVSILNWKSSIRQFLRTVTCLKLPPKSISFHGEFEQDDSSFIRFDWMKLGLGQIVEARSAKGVAIATFISTDQVLN